MKKQKRFVSLCLMLLVIFAAGPVVAAPVSQTFTLHPGWNAVFLEVNPDPAQNDPATVFGGIADLISVWRWNPNTSTVEFIQDPNVPVPDQSTWLAYYHNNGTPPSALQSLILTNLNTVQGNTAYLIQRGGSANTNYVVSGEPVIQDIHWQPNTFNFVGFHLVTGQEPTFTDFFSSSPAHADQTIYVLRNDIWVEATPSDVMLQGEGFWVYCHGSSEFDGPISLQLDVYDGLHYGTVLDEQGFLLNNDDDNSHQVTVTPTAAAPYLYYWKFNDGDGSTEWVPFSAGTLTVDLAANASQRIKVGVKRGELTADQVYATNLAVSDTTQQLLVPVSVTGINHQGLWSGYATIDEVSEVRKGTTPLPTGSEFSFRLLVHIDNTGQVRLLQHIVQMWQEGTWKPDPENLGKLIIDTPGSFVLLTDHSLIPYYSGASLIDGRLVGRRISSSAFGFSAPLPVTGDFQPGSTLEVTVPLDKTDPVNPFVHRYHPKFFVPAEDGGVWNHGENEMFTVSRAVSMEFADNMMDGSLILQDDVLNWGSTVVGGVYKETISGLHKDPIYIQGTFTLHRISSVDQLTTAAP